MGGKCLQLHFSCFSHTKGLYFFFFVCYEERIRYNIKKVKLITFYLSSEVKNLPLGLIIYTFFLA